MLLQVVPFSQGIRLLDTFIFILRVELARYTELIVAKEVGLLDEYLYWACPLVGLLWQLVICHLLTLSTPYMEVSIVLLLRILLAAG